MARAGSLAFMFALCAGADVTSADEVVLWRGATFTGRILAEDSAGVRIDTVTQGIRATLTFARQEIRSVTRGPLPDSFFDAQAPHAPKVNQPPGPPKAPIQKSDDELRSEMVQSLIRSAEKGDAKTMWALVEVYRNGYGNVPQNHARMASWLQRLCARGEERAHIELATHSTDAYARICQRAGVDPDPALIGKAVEITGLVGTSASERLILKPLRTPEDGRQLSVDWSLLDLPKAMKRGRAATVRGMVRQDRSILGLAVEVPLPKFEYRYALHQHTVVPDYQQHWIVTVTVTNTGVQPIRSIELTVRCSDKGSPNAYNPPETVIVRDLPPGEERSEDTRISLYFQSIGGTSSPKVTVTAGDPVS